MEVLHMNQPQLANRWGVSEACLEHCRSKGVGPQFLKLRGRVLYRQIDIEAFEEGCLRQSTSRSVLKKMIYILNIRQIQSGTGE